MTDTPLPRWGFYVGGAFVEVPRLPLERASLSAPCTVMIGVTERHIVVDQDA